MQNRIRLGLLGAGMIGRSYIKEAKDSSEFEVIGFHDRNPNSQLETMNLYKNLKFFSTKEDLFNSNLIDALVIGSRHQDHAMQAIEALKCGKHVLIEKPIATNLEDLHELNNIQKKHSEYIVTALPHKNDPLISAAKDIINSGFLGEITAFHSYLDVPGPPRSNWYYAKSSVGGASLDTLPYALMRLLSLVDCDLKSVQGFKNQLIQKRLCLDSGKVDCYVDDNALLTIELESGQQAFVRSNWNTSYPEDFLVIKGRQGDLWLDCWKQKIILISSNLNEFEGYEKIEWLGREGYVKQVERESCEAEKLNVFSQQIQAKAGNLDEVSFGMELIFRCLFKKEILRNLASPFSKRPTLKNMNFKNEYV